MSPSRTESPIVQVGDDQALVYSVRELGQQAARIMTEIENSGKPAIITRDGRFVATVTPLAPGQVESRILPEMARQIAKRDHG